MNYPAIYIRSKGGFSRRYRELAGDALLVVNDVSTAVRTISSRKTDRGIIFYEQNNLTLDVQNIRFLRSWFASYAIVLVMGKGLCSEERREYLQAGVNTALKGDTDPETFHETVQFLCDHTFNNNPVVEQSTYEITPYRIPLWKRTFDIFASGATLLILSPLLLFVALAIKLDSPGPVLYRSKRVGSNYRVFDFFKFRSMRPDADLKIKEFSDLNQYTETKKESAPEAGKISLSNEEMEEILKTVEGGGMLLSDDFLITEEIHQRHVSTEQQNAFVKIQNDPRITSLGRFLRKYSIDELPQLLNIFRGDMSVVGNRPLPLYEAENLTSDEYIERFMCPSGLTGLWQVEKRGGKGKLSPEQRKQLDIRYAKEMSFLLDMKIIFRTFTAFIQKENV